MKAIFLHAIAVIDGMLIAALGERTLAAMGIAVAIGGFFLSIQFAFSNALQIRTAQAYGTRNSELIGKVFVSGLLLGLSFGLVGVIAIQISGRWLLSKFSNDPFIVEQAWSYLSVFSVIILFEGFGQNLAAYFNGSGRSKVPLIGYIFSLPINVVISIVLIYGFFGLPEFGLSGAAIGSALGVSVLALYLAIEFFRQEKTLIWTYSWDRNVAFDSLIRHFSFSWPIAATFISATFASHVSMLIYAQMSVFAFAAMTLINPWIMIAGTVGMQWAQATGIFVAQLLGEKRDEKELDEFLSHAWKAGFIAALVVALVYALICLFANRLYPSLAAETLSILLSFIFVLVLVPFPKQSNANCGNTLRASGDTVFVMWVFIGSQWLFRVPATAICVLYFEWPALIVLSLLFWEELIKFPFFHVRLWQGHWKRARVNL